MAEATSLVAINNYYPVPTDLECELFHPNSVLTTLGQGWLAFHEEQKILSADVQIEQPFGPVYIGFRTSSDYAGNIIALYERMMAHARTGGVITINAGKPEAVSYKYNATPRHRFTDAAIGFVRVAPNQNNARRMMFAKSGPAFRQR